MGDHEYHVNGDLFSGWTAHCKCGFVSMHWGRPSLALDQAHRHALTVELVDVAA